MPFPHPLAPRPPRRNLLRATDYRSPSPASRFRETRALSLVEVMCSIFILGLVMLGLIGNFIQSRRVTESAVLHAAATADAAGQVTCRAVPEMRRQNTCSSAARTD